MISEINRNKLVKICKFLKNKNTSVIYLADSLGALTEKIKFYSTNNEAKMEKRNRNSCT